MIFKSLINSSDHSTHSSGIVLRKKIKLSTKHKCIDLLKQHYFNGIDLLSMHNNSFFAENRVIVIAGSEFTITDEHVRLAARYDDIYENVIYFNQAIRSDEAQDNTILDLSMFYCDYFTYMKFCHVYQYINFIPRTDFIKSKWSTAKHVYESDTIKILCAAFDLKFSYNTLTSYNLDNNENN